MRETIPTIADPVKAINYPNKADKFTPMDAEMEVEQAEEEREASRRAEEHQHAKRSVPLGNTGLAMGDRDRVPRSSSFNFNFASSSNGENGPTSATASASASASGSRGNGNGTSPAPATTPMRRRSGAPMSIPNFPLATEPRTSATSTPFSPSPSNSPKGSSPFRSPFSPPNSTPARPGGLAPPPQPFAASSPWHSLAATSGAPTPSLDGPGRSSPHLGGPFEKLNLGGSWSGGNLWGDVPDDRSSEAVAASHTGAGPAAPFKFGATGASGAGGMSADMLAKYRAMAGKASAQGTNGKAMGNGLPDRAVTAEVPSAPKPSLPAALAKRRTSLPKNILGTLTPPALAHLSKSPSPLASEASSSSPGPSKLQPLSVSQLASLVSRSSTLILDLRPPSSFQNSHLASSHSLPIPSTLLRRPAFNTTRLINMLASPSKEEVATWREKSDIVLIDADSGSVTDGSVIEGLAGKFEREEFSGHVWFVRGGHSAAEAAGLPMVSDETDEEEDDDAEAASLAPTDNSLPAMTSPGSLKAGKLGRRAFQSGSTGSGRPSRTGSAADLLVETPALSLRSDPFATSVSGSSMSERSLKPNFGSRSQASLVSNSSTTSSRRVPDAKLQPANPFFDNIRQNLELSHGGITERISLGVPEEAKRRAHELPAFLAELVEMPEDDSAEKLAQQFYQIELGEQKRLQAVMDWHTNGSGASLGAGTATEWQEQKEKDEGELERLKLWDAGAVSPAGEYFPFSITAGVERGTKNRYKNIWPYDFSRVRLEAPTDDDSDYINASFVQPRGTSRRYIATQGPLDATYRDFWALVWEQNVRVIVMLTKQYEGGLLKCGNYWGDQQYGPLHVHLVSQTGGEDHVQQQTTGFDFGMAAVTPREDESEEVESNIRRTFVLTHDQYKDQPPRTIIQIQCVAWPDFDVPDNPDILLSLIKDTDNAVEEAMKRPCDDRAELAPVLVHCSAGVGRTGSFIIVDAMLDALRREIKNARGDAFEEPDKVPRLPTLSSEPQQAPSNGNAGGKFSSGASNSSSYYYAASAAGSGGSGSGKSVSFVNTPAHIPSPPPHRAQMFSYSTTLSSSPYHSTPESTITPSSSNTASDTNKSSASAPKKLDIKAANAVADASGTKQETEGSGMDVDSPVAEKELGGPSHDERFTKHRESVAPSMSSSEGDSKRRPSLASTFASSEKVTSETGRADLQMPKPIIKSSVRHRTPSPISEMDNPVQSVLEGMRVQRMSLVQSLRQFVFVHRAIIHNYLAMVDDEAETDTNRGSTVSDSEPAGSFSRGSTAPTTSLSTTAPSSVVGAEDEWHQKRRASPTELQPEWPVTAGKTLPDSGSGELSRRASVKRLKAGEALEMGAAGGGGATNTAPSSPGRPGSRRRGSKLGLTDEK